MSREGETREELGGPNFSYKNGHNQWNSSEAKQAITNKLSESLESKEQVTNKLVGINGLT